MWPSQNIHMNFNEPMGIRTREGPIPNFLPSGILKFGNGNFSGIQYSRIFRVQEFREFGIPVRDYQTFGIPVHLG